MPDIEPHPGPDPAPAAAAGAGLRTSTCLRYRLSASDPGSALPLPRFWEERALTLDDELVWAVFPSFDADAEDVLDGFRAAAVAIDLVFDTGHRLLAHVAQEVDGTSTAARERTDLDFPDQWNERRVSLARFAGARIVAAELACNVSSARGSTGEVLEGWLDALRIAAAPLEPSGGPSERVSTTRGSHSSPWRSRGNTQPLTGVPHGHLYLAPATDLSNPHWTYSWNAHGPGPHPFLAGLLITRSPSIWIGDRAALAIRVGLVADEATGVAPEEFDHDDELARPHRYQVTTLSGLRIDAAATTAAIAAEITFPSPGRFVLCAPGAQLSHLEHTLTSDGGLHVRVASTLPSPHESDPLRGYYALTFTGARFRTQQAEGMLIVEVIPTDGAVRIEVGGSLLSSTQADIARLTLSGRSIDAIAQAAALEWDALLTTVDAPNAPASDRGLLASDLYRLFLYPTRHHEETPAGPRYASPAERESEDGPDATGRQIRSGLMLTDNGFWDTYRTAWPAYNLLAPEQAGDLLNGMLEHVRVHGWSPRWTAGTPLDAMVGTSLDVIAADAVACGIPGVDIETAYAAALRNVTAAASDPRFGRKGMPQSLALGYTPSTINESVSWTIEGAINDAGAAVLAREMARICTPERAPRLRAEARFLAHRALSYRALWDAESRFFRPRTTAGHWADVPFDPRVWGGAHTETNAWGSRFPAPHDGVALAEIFGGATRLGDALDDYFRENETADLAFAGSYGEVIHEMPEARDIRRGMWALSNQPAHHVPWMYAFSDRPWRTGEFLHDAVRRLFRGSSIGQGFPGDEDNGEMSAWHLFAQLGFAPFQPGSGRLLITAPTLERATVSPLGANPINVVTRRRHDTDRYIRTVRWNGAEWTTPTVDVQTLHEGGQWEVELGPRPVAWSPPIDARPFFAPDGVATVALTNAVQSVSVDHAVLGPGNALSLRPGSEVELSLIPRTFGDDPALLVLGLETSGTHAFRAEILTGDGWHMGTTWNAETWAWDQQARPFELDVPPAARAIRVVWEGEPAVLTLVQVLVP